MSEPNLIFSSSSDQTGVIPGLTCVPLEQRLPGTSPKQWYDFWRIGRLIEGLPF